MSEKPSPYRSSFVRKRTFSVLHAHHPKEGESPLHHAPRPRWLRLTNYTWTENAFTPWLQFFSSSCFSLRYAFFLSSNRCLNYFAILTFLYTFFSYFDLLLLSYPVYEFSWDHIWTFGTCIFHLIYGNAKKSCKFYARLKALLYIRFTESNVWS